ncbi:MAG: hypothetical protein R2880_02125 [Deinococcales bacterium]
MPQSQQALGANQSQKISEQAKALTAEDVYHDALSYRKVIENP